eukprot:SAG31_NODE_5331_length_2604_cov_1.514571_3_plen_46_part_00
MNMESMSRDSMRLHPLAAVAVELITGKPLTVDQTEKFTPRDNNGA